MSEKRGYPNPNYKAEDVMDVEDGIELEELGLVTLDLEHYEELVSKAAMFDCLASTVKSTGKVNEDFVKAITGNMTEEPMVTKKEADKYWNYYCEESTKRQNLEKKVAQLEKAKKELIEILRQQGITAGGTDEFPPMDEEEIG
jgi:hypothetical protein